MASPAMKVQRLETTPIYREASFNPKTVNEEERTIELVWTTGARVLRTPFWDEPYYEELAVDSGAIRLIVQRWRSLIR